MNWYYAEEGASRGPVSEDEFQQLVRAGTITRDTLVWSDGMSDWVPHARVLDPEAAPLPSPAETLPADVGRCVECRAPFPRRDMVAYGAHLVCAGCRDIFFQKVREGVELPPPVDGVQLRYAGFWIRAGAKVIDSVLLFIINTAAEWVFNLAVSEEAAFRAAIRPFSSPEGLILFGIETAIGIALVTAFVGGLGATPGKLALGLRVVKPDGSKVGFGRAFGRSWAEYLSSLLLCLGYLQAVGDDEKRTLHDRICATRVVRA